MFSQMIENQGELMAALQRNREQKELIKQLEKKSQAGSPDGSEHLQTQVEAGGAEEHRRCSLTSAQQTSVVAILTRSKF